MESEQHQLAYKSLLELAKNQGYVTFDDIMEVADQFSLSIQDFDRLSSAITTLGIIVYAEKPSSQMDIRRTDPEDDIDDFAQTDYEVIYKRIVELNPSLKPLVEYIRKIIPPQKKEIRKLKYQIAEGNSFARSRMIEMHLRLALRIALQRAELYDMEIDDAISYSFIGLIYAVDKYDPDTFGAFASYAALWIVQSISREQYTQRPLVYYPVHKKEAYFTMYPILKSHGCIGCRELVDCQKARTMVMNKLLCDETEASSIILEAVPEESVETLMEAAQNTIFNDADSILVNVDSNDGNPNWEKELFYATLSSDMITNDDEDFHTLSNKFLHQALEQALALLSDRESEVLRQRYGYYGREKTLEEVGQMFGITRERVRQIEAKALRKLRHPSRSKPLKDFL